MIKNELEDIKIKNEQEFFGIYRGVVEEDNPKENNVELQDGRIRVRVWGLHNKDKQLLPTEHLPLAQPAYPNMIGSITGKGVWSVPVQGTHVFVFFENGDPMQPRYFATAPGIEPANMTFKSNEGFTDPDKAGSKSDCIPLTDAEEDRLVKIQEIFDFWIGRYTKKYKELQQEQTILENKQVAYDACIASTSSGSGYPLSALMNQPDMNKLMRNDAGVDGTAWENIKSTTINMGCMIVPWNPGEHDVTYPNNFVLETRDLQTLEMNPNATLLYHNKDSYLLLKADGESLLKGGLSMTGGMSSVSVTTGSVLACTVVALTSVTTPLLYATTIMIGAINGVGGSDFADMYNNHTHDSGTVGPPDPAFQV